LTRDSLEESVELGNATGDLLDEEEASSEVSSEVSALTGKVEQFEEIDKPSEAKKEEPKGVLGRVRSWFSD
jgi:hypothetical protein